MHESFIIAVFVRLADTGRTTLRAQNDKMVSIARGKREVLVEHFSAPQARNTHTTNEDYSSRRKSTRGQGRMYMHQNGNRLVHKDYTEISHK